MQQVEGKRVFTNYFVLLAVMLFCIAGLAISRVNTAESLAETDNIEFRSAVEPSRIDNSQPNTSPINARGGATLPGRLVHTRGNYFQPNIESVTDIGGNNVVSGLSYLGDHRSVFSPDGNKILFLTQRNGEFGANVFDLYSMNIDGSDQIKLAGNFDFDNDFAFSPDSTKVVYTSNNNIWRMSADGSAKTELLDLTEDIRSPAYSPDGMKIVFLVDSKIWTMNGDGTNAADIGMIEYTEQFDQKPDGSKIVFSSNDEIYTINYDGTNETKIIDDDNVGYYLLNPKYSPDGTKLLMECRNMNNRTNVCTSNADGSNFVPVLGEDDDRSWPAWSPDGNGVAFVVVDYIASTYSIKAAVLGQEPFLVTTAPNGDLIQHLAWQPNCTLVGGPTPTPTPTATPTPLAGLISEWNASAMNADDSIGTNHGQFLDGAGLIDPGKSGLGFYLPGNGGYILIPDDDSLDVQTGDYTLSAWFNPLGSAEHYVVGKGACGESSSNFYIGVNTDYRPFIDISHASGGSRVSWGQQISGFSWHHLLLRKEGTNFRLYVNGSLAINHQETQPMNVGTQPFTIGKGDGCTPPQLSTNGGVDEVRLYGRALSETEIGQIFDGSSLTSKNIGPSCEAPIDPPLGMRVRWPHPQGAGRPGYIELKVTEPPPPGGTVVNLTYSDPGVVNGPATVTIPENNNLWDVQFTTTLGSTFRTGDVIATSGSNTSRVTVSVAPAAPDVAASNLTAPATVSILQNFTTSWRITNNGQAPTDQYREDRLYISSDDILFNSPNDIDVGRSYENGASIAPGAFRDVTFNQVNIPAAAIPTDGTYYLFVYVGISGTVNERNGNWNDNYVGIPITVNRNLPDIIAQNIVAPTEIEPRQMFTITWDARNQGSAATLTPFTQDVYYSFDQTIGNADDLLMTQRYDPIMGVGEVRSYSQQYFFNTTPVRPSSDGLFYVRVDSGNQVFEDVAGGPAETNNVTSFASRWEYRVPDVQVASVTPPTEVESDTSFAVSWTTQNAGNKTASAMTEAVYFSTDNVVSGNDTLLGYFTLNQTLEPGQSVNRTQNVTIPTNAITATGNYFVYVVTDAFTQIDEGANESNNTTFSPLRVRRLLRPDLQVTNITAPATAFFDQEIQVQWTVSNNGTGPTNAANWQDDVYLGVNQTLNGATRLATLSNISFLNAGESYIATATVRIPRGASGSYYVIVKTDKDNLVNEENENNNLTTRPITINIPPLPDVRVSNVQAPETGIGGQSILVSWTVTNHGDGSTPSNESNWSDGIYISRDAVFGGDDRFIGARPRSGVLAPNGTYTVSDYAVTLPGDAFGNYYVFVFADAYDQLYEFTSNGNNTNYDATAPGSPMNVLGTPPDLTVLSPITAPTSALAGNQISVQFTVQNQGAFDATGGWWDTVYLSSDAVFDPNNDTPIGSAVQNGLVAGNQYGRNITATVPGCMNGTYYLFAVTDSQGQIFEYDIKGNAETNNISAAKQISISSFAPDLQVTNITIPPVVINGAMPISWTVKNFGTAATLPNPWADQVLLVYNAQVYNLGVFERGGGLAIGGEYTQNRVVYIPLFLEGEMQIIVRADAYNNVAECSYELNNEVSGYTSVQQDLPDLRINSVNSQSAASLGQTFNVSWTGGNNSAAMTSSASWSDTVYLSSDATLALGDTPIGSVIRSGQLASGQTYSANANVTIPNVAPGNYYLIVNADNGGHIVEGVNETNNASTAMAITITAPMVDLHVTNVTADPVIYSGQFTNISWTVANLGSTQTLSSSWIDHVILSRDNILDTSDVVIESRVRNGALAGGSNYTETRSIAIPAGLTGEYKIFVATDRWNNVVESLETNNISVPTTVDLQLPPPAELNITNIAPPPTMSLGETATITWTVQNSSANVVNGVWQDSLYLSADNTWDSSDVLIGQNVRSGTVGAFATYTETKELTVPPVEVGTYYLIVRTDTRNSVRESNEANNVSSSVGQTTVSIPNLTLGTALMTSLITGQERYYSILNTPADETMLITLDGEDGSQNELYSRYGTMVSRSNFERQGVLRGFPDQENVFESTTAGAYYTMARGDYVPSSFAEELKKGDEAIKAASMAPQAVAIKAEILPFGIRTVSPEQAGNKGYSFLSIDGAKFQPGASVKLVGNGGTELYPMKTLDGGPSNIKALFDLNGKAVGDYQVVVTNPNSQSSTHVRPFKIKSGGGEQIRTEIAGASEVNTRGFYRYTVSVSNSGLNDGLSIPIVFVISGLYDYQLSSSNRFQAETAGFDASVVPTHFDIDGKRVIVLYAPVVRAGESVNIGINIKFGNAATLTAVALPSLFTPNIDLGALRSSLGSGIPDGLDVANCFANLVIKALLTVLSEIIPADCGYSIANAILGLSETAFSNFRGGFDAYSTASSLLQSAINVAGDCAKNMIRYIPWIKFASILYDIYQIIQIAIECAKKSVEFVMQVNLSRSIDPNEKLGPTGFGPERWVAKDKPLLYRINFENLSTATAPAQRIQVIDQLPATLDPRTLRLLEIGFKQYRVEVPANRAFYQNRLQLGADLNNLKADISAGLDITTGRVTWTLTAIDPNTNERPLSPLLGLLPPNNEQRDGEGYVIFSVAPKSNVLTRTDIANSAEIYFDENDPIITNATTNLVDADIPTSQLSPLPATTGDPSISLSWSGTDDANGSGLKSFDIFASENGGAYLPVVTGTTENGIVFNGKYGRSYRFYSVAQDNSGNIESAPEVHDAEITVLGGAYETDVASRPNGNNDGTVNSQDVDQVRRFVAKLDTDYQYNEFQRADAAPLAEGGNGEVSVADVVQANRYAGGQDAIRFNAGPLAAVSVREGSTKVGRNAGQLPRAISPRTLFRNGNTIQMEINLEAQGDEVGVGFTMNYNTAHLSNPRSFTVGSGIAGGNVLANTSVPGQIGIVVDRSPSQPIAAGTRQIVTLEFDVNVTAPTTTPITFSSDIVKNEVADTAASVLTTAFDPASISLLAPTSSTVTVSGRIISRTGKAVRDTIVFLADDTGAARRTISDRNGIFRIDDVETGRTYVLTVRNKSFRFEQPTRVITVTDSINEIEFVTVE